MLRNISVSILLLLLSSTCVLSQGYIPPDNGASGGLGCGGINPCPASQGGTGVNNSTNTLTVSGGSTTTVPSSYAVTFDNVSLGAAGTGYAPGDVSTLSGGTFTTAGTIGIVATQVISATVAAGGGSCANGASQTVTGTTGTGTKFQALVTVSGNAIIAVNSISVAGVYTVNPTVLTAEPVTGVSCSGSQLSVVMGALVGIVQQGGVYSAAPAFASAGPPPSWTLSEASSTGLGTGATWNVAFAPIASTVSYLASNPSNTNPNNTVLGASAGVAQTSAIENTLIGFQAGLRITTGGENTLIGWQAGKLLTSSTGNTFVGAGPVLISTGNNNTIVGQDAGRNTVGGSSLTLFGQDALLTSTATNTNFITAIGKSAMGNWSASLNGSANDVALGNSACIGAASGTRNFIKVTCLGSTTGGALTTGSTNTLIGFGVGNTTLASGAGNILIGSGVQTVDTAAGGTSNTINIENVITATGTGTPSTSTTTIAGTLNVAGTSGYQVGGTPGVSCSAGILNPVTAVVTNGIITHC